MPRPVWCHSKVPSALFLANVPISSGTTLTSILMAASCSLKHLGDLGVVAAGDRLKLDAEAVREAGLGHQLLRLLEVLDEVLALQLGLGDRPVAVARRDLGRERRVAAVHLVDDVLAVDRGADRLADPLVVPRLGRVLGRQLGLAVGREQPLQHRQRRVVAERPGAVAGDGAAVDGAGAQRGDAGLLVGHDLEGQLVQVRQARLPEVRRCGCRRRGRSGRTRPA